MFESLTSHSKLLLAEVLGYVIKVVPSSGLDAVTHAIVVAKQIDIVLAVAVALHYSRPVYFDGGNWDSMGLRLPAFPRLYEIALSN